ncbi:hypothetical protein [Bacillus cereus group sp. BfR-BA-01310]|uniref:hypothetical protein n=1 Tax=Bacillus cereus group sp. BfR-BA-01310 TaxID=2920287 RepID=UPI001F5883A0|nr:hypothetical protein [Bacillus cereus group sp. BfR-BA-01310]
MDNKKSQKNADNSRESCEYQKNNNNHLNQENSSLGPDDISDEEYFKMLYKVDPTQIEYKVLSSDVYTTTFLSLDHLRAAKLFVDNSKEIFDMDNKFKNQEERIKNIFNYRSYVLSAITSSVAFMEATINEIYVLSSNKDEFNDIYGANVNESVLQKIRDTVRIKEDTLHNKAFKITQAFNVNRVWWKDISILIELRNHLIHYHPVIDLHTGGEKVNPTKIETLCQNLFKFETTLLADDDNPPFFPDKLGYECANWSLIQSNKFIRKLFKQLNLNSLVPLE